MSRALGPLPDQRPNQIPYTNPLLLVRHRRQNGLRYLLLHDILDVKDESLFYLLITTRARTESYRPINGGGVALTAIAIDSTASLSRVIGFRGILMKKHVTTMTVMLPM